MGPVRRSASHADQADMLYQERVPMFALMDTMLTRNAVNASSVMWDVPLATALSA
jgi:hypothetical protein